MNPAIPPKTMIVEVNGQKVFTSFTLFMKSPLGYGVKTSSVCFSILKDLFLKFCSKLESIMKSWYWLKKSHWKGVYEKTFWQKDLQNWKRRQRASLSLSRSLLLESNWRLFKTAVQYLEQVAILVALLLSPEVF